MGNDLMSKGDSFNKKETVLAGDRADINVTNTSKNKGKEIAIIAFGGLFILGAVGTIIVLNLKGGEEKTITVGNSDKEQYLKDYDSNNSLNSQKKIIMTNLKETVVLEEPQSEPEPELESEFKPEPLPQVVYIEVPKEPTKSKQDLELLYGGETLLNPSNIASKEAMAKDTKYQKDDLTPAEKMGSARRSGLDNNTLGRSEMFADGYVEKTLDRDFLLPSGTAMACVLKTKVVTNYGGVTLCQLSRDIYSANGKNLLVRAGAMLQGTQTEAILRGKSRVFISWTHLVDNDITVRIDGLGTDSLGASGVPAWIDNHFWERFGNAILLSFFDDATSVATSYLNKNIDAENVTIDSTSQNINRMAEIALENSIDIQPTAYINQGSIINVIVPRNVDFSSVYKNVYIKNRY